MRARAGVGGAGAIEKGRPLDRVVMVQGVDEQRFFPRGGLISDGPKLPALNLNAPSGPKLRTESERFSTNRPLDRIAANP